MFMYDSELKGIKLQLYMYTHRIKITWSAEVDVLQESCVSSLIDNRNMTVMDKKK